MKISNRGIDKITTKIKDEFVRIMKCYYLGPVINPVENDFLNNDLCNIFLDVDENIDEGSFIEFKNNEKAECRYFDKIIKFTNVLDFSCFETNDCERVFLVNNLSCKENKMVQIKVVSKCKLKIWINGLLVFNSIASLRDSPIFLYELQKGNNMVLAELFHVIKDTSVALSIISADYYHSLASRNRI